MIIVVSGTIAAICYLAATVMQIQNILKGAAFGPWVKLTGAIGILFHAVTTYQGFFHEAGIDLGIYPMLSLMALSIVSIVMLSSLRRPIDNLFIVIFPIAIVTVLLAVMLQGDYAPREDITNGIFGHITLSVVAYSLLTIAAAQALLLSFGDSLLRHHRLLILRNMPPLETMEQLMFEMIWVGLVFLTASIATGFMFLQTFSSPGLIHHTVITMAAWAVFAVLLWGRYQLGWRGAIASRWALSGFVLLALGYFGSKVALELILGQS